MTRDEYYTARLMTAGQPCSLEMGMLMLMLEIDATRDKALNPVDVEAEVRALVRSYLRYKPER